MVECPPGRVADPATGAPVERAVGAEGLRMDYGSTRVLGGLDLTVRAGEVEVLLGPNGAGKTTTIEILEGFRCRSVGRVEGLGQEPARVGEAWRADLGMVLQSWRDHGVWRVREPLHHFGRYYATYSTPERVRPFDAGAFLGRVGLAGHVRRQVESLSGGQRHRLDVAIGLVGRPRLLFLEEPTADFDPQARRNVHELVHDIVDENDTAVLLTTHDLDEAERLADRTLVLTGGRIVADGSAEQLATGLGGDSEVAWTVDGRRSVHSTRAPVEFVAGLYADHEGSVTDLRGTRPTLENVYMDLVRRHESGDIENAAAELERTARGNPPRTPCAWGRPGGGSTSSACPRPPGELFGYVFCPAVFLGIAAGTTIEHAGTGTDGSAYLMTGGMALLPAHTLLLVAQTIGSERGDGTLSRAEALPHGMLGHTVGKSLQLMSISAVSLVLTLVGALVLVGGFSVQGWSGAIPLSGFCALGILMLSPYGAILGSLTNSPRMAVAVAMIALLSLSLVSGVFFPVGILPSWAGAIGTVFPLYWIGAGLRAALLPEAQVAMEATGSWELPKAMGVLMVWIVVGFLLTPWVLRRMARRESGSRVSEAEERVMQRAY